MSYVLNFLVEILVILTQDLGSTDQNIKYYSFHVMWVVGFEVSRFPVHFNGQVRTSLHDQDVKGQKSIISFNFCCEFDDRSKAVEVVKKLLQYCWPM
jgi:hypothetical protein